MAYSAEFSSSDMSAVIIDLVVSVGAGVVGFATLVGLVLLYRWFKKRGSM